MITLYIAGAISGDTTQFLHNISRGIEKSAELIELGFAVVSPFIDYQFMLMNRRITVSQLQKNSIELMLRCDAVYVLKNYEESIGTAREISIAFDHGKGVYYEDNITVNDLRDMLQSEGEPEEVKDESGD